jgi:hypothetical protein
MLRSVAVWCGALSLAVLMNISVIAQLKAVDSPLKGAWRVSELLEGPGAPNASPFPSMWVFTDRHYSAMAVIGPRPKFAPGKATDAEKIATYDAFAGNSGTYEVNGNIVTLHALVGKNEYIVGTSQRAEFKQIDGNTLIWTSGPGAVVKFTRLE